MNIRKIDVPETVENLPTVCASCNGTGLGGAEGKLPFKSFVMMAMDKGAEGKGGLDWSRKLNKIADKIEGCDGQLILEETEYDLVKRTVDNFPWNPGLARHCEPYFAAMEEAVSSKEEKKKKEESPKKE